MSTDARVLLKGKISVRQVENFLKNQLGLEVSVNTDTRVYKHYLMDSNIVDTTVYLGVEGVETVTSSMLNFTYKGAYCTLYYDYRDTVPVYKDIVELGISLGDMGIAGEVTRISSVSNEPHIEVMTALAKYFRGYIDENDCDEFGYHKVK